MLNKFFILLIFTVSCGPQVKLKANKLEDPSLLTSNKSHEMTGTLTKGSKNQVQYNSKTYDISIYSSKDAQNFVAAMKDGATSTIIFTGGFKGTEVVIETIR